MAHPDFHPEIDRGALMLYLRHNYIPAPHSIYRGIFKLPPAALLKIRPDRPGELPAPIPYCPLWKRPQNGLADPISGGPEETADRLEALMREAVQMRMISDVPLGAFLSGGIDSSTVVALMQAGSSRPVKTFSIGFEEEAYNEAPFAKEVARHLGTEHTELYVSPQETLDVVPKLADLYDEPFSDSSQIPTYLVSRLARRHVTVSLSGDAGDELFGGYDRYFWARSLWNKIGGAAASRPPPGRRRHEPYAPKRPGLTYPAPGPLGARGGRGPQARPSGQDGCRSFCGCPHRRPCICAWSLTGGRKTASCTGCASQAAI